MQKPYYILSLPQPSEILTDKSSWALLDHLHAERTRHVGLIAVALDGNVLRPIECLVCTAIVHPLGIGLRGTLIATYGESCKESMEEGGEGCRNSSSIEKNEFKLTGKTRKLATGTANNIVALSYA